MSAWWRRNQPALAAAIAASQPMKQQGPELVIFDKDGTLIDFKFMWGKWAERLCDNMSPSLNLPTMKVLTNALGYDRATGKVSNRSPICCSPMHQIEQICIDALSTSMDRPDAERILKQHWDMPDPVRDSKPLTDLVSLFKLLREEMGMKIAVCTTDNRKETLSTLKMLKVDHLVSAVLCGDDKHVAPKPSADQIHHICEYLDVPVHKTVMVGDTITDMKMARAANVALGVGIPFGAGSTEDLLEHADVILPTMDNFARLLSQGGLNHLALAKGR